MSEQKWRFDERDPRLKELLLSLSRMAAGEIDLRVPVTGSRDAIDAISYAINVLAGELAYQQSLRLAESEKARATAEQTSRTKSQFLANMSHELRTPLSAILGYAELLVAPGIDQAERESHATRIRDNGRLLLQLIDDILDLSKVEAGRLRIRHAPVNVMSVAREVISDLSDRALGKGLRLRLVEENAPPPCVRTDQLRLRQILTNLVGNAVKFTEKGRVELKLSHLQGSPMIQLVAEVRDTGPGMDPDQAKRLFEPFVQLDPSTGRRFGGTGLGLALSRHLARLLGGELELVATKPDQGSTFRLTLEVEPCDQAPPDPQEQARQLHAVAHSGSLTGKRILLVDDAPDNRMVYSAFLKRVGAEVVAAPGGAAALAAWTTAQANPATAFDLILLDLQMPGMDGFECLKELQELGCNIPVLALTAHALRDHRQRGLEAGFRGYLTKPLGADEFVAGVIEALKTEP
ncbi:MAG: response regulator [Bdellovibrionales bacterium]|nr:response regulator [Bdellovibrionales bacterium]